MKSNPLEYSVYNKMKDVAELAIERVLKDEKDACKCPTCREDMKCLILNRLKPDYQVVGQQEKEGIGQIRHLEDLEQDLFNQVMVECYRALVLVKKSPRHEEERSSLHNSQKDIVLGALREILRQEERELNFAKLSEVMAFVLNNLEPKYTTTYKGDVYARTVEIDAAYLAKIYANIFNALSGLKATSTL